MHMLVSQRNVVLLLGAQLRGSCLHHRMVSQCTGSGRNSFEITGSGACFLHRGFAEEYCMPDGKLEAPHAHPVCLVPMHPAGLISTLVCATHHLLFRKRGPRYQCCSQLSRSYHTLWTPNQHPDTQLVPLGLHDSPSTSSLFHYPSLKFQCALWSYSPK